MSALWPNKTGMSVVLDLGANIECSPKNLFDFSIMGASLYTSLYPNKKPNIGLLNIGSEELKGNETIKETFKILSEKKSSNFDFSGYIEGNEIMNGNVNVIISDGFTGNIALKTAEGTANFIVKELKKSMTSSILGKIASLLNYSNLNKFKKPLHATKLMEEVKKIRSINYDYQFQPKPPIKLFGNNIFGLDHWSMNEFVKEDMRVERDFLTEDQIEILKKMLTEGKSIEKVSQEINCPRHTVRVWAIRFGIKT